MALPSIGESSGPAGSRKTNKINDLEDHANESSLFYNPREVLILVIMYLEKLEFKAIAKQLLSESERKYGVALPIGEKVRGLDEILSDYLDLAEQNDSVKNLMSSEKVGLQIQEEVLRAFKGVTQIVNDYSLMRSRLEKLGLEIDTAKDSEEKLASLSTHSHKNGNALADGGRSNNFSVNIGKDFASSSGKMYNRTRTDSTNRQSSSRKFAGDQKGLNHPENVEPKANENSLCADGTSGQQQTIDGVDNVGIETMNGFPYSMLNSMPPLDLNSKAQYNNSIIEISRPSGMQEVVAAMKKMQHGIASKAKSKDENGVSISSLDSENLRQPNLNLNINSTSSRGNNMLDLPLSNLTFGGANGGLLGGEDTSMSLSDAVGNSALMNGALESSRLDFDAERSLLAAFPTTASIGALIDSSFSTSMNNRSSDASPTDVVSKYSRNNTAENNRVPLNSTENVDESYAPRTVKKRKTAFAEESATDKIGTTLSKKKSKEDQPKASKRRITPMTVEKKIVSKRTKPVADSKTVQREMNRTYNSMDSFLDQVHGL